MVVLFVFDHFIFFVFVICDNVLEANDGERLLAIEKSRESTRSILS